MIFIRTYAKGPPASIIKKLEAEFNIITTHGRSHYRNFFEPKDGLFLSIVNHKNNQNPMIDHFGEWRLSLERLLVWLERDVQK